MPPGKGRHPTSENDFISEINNISVAEVAGIIGDLKVINAKKRMEKMFEFARTRPREFFKQMREQSPVFLSEGAAGSVLGKDVKIPNVYLVTRYADVKTVLDKNTVYTVKPYQEIMDATVGSPYMLGREMTTANEEKAHMHPAVGGTTNAAKVREIIRHIAQEAIREGSKDGQIDVVKSVTRRVPLGLNEEYFGFNGPSRAALARWSEATQHAFFHNPFKDKDVNRKSVKAGNEMRAWIAKDLVPERTKELQNGRPANDVVSQVIKIGDVHRSAGFDNERIVANIIGLLVGSVETTSAAIAQSLQVIMSRPDVFKYAKELAQAGDDQKLSALVWEALRFDPVNPWLARYSESDSTLAGVFIPKGSLILASTESAMFDETVFPQPDVLRVGRDQSLYYHLGYGYHRCLGDDVSLVMVPETIKQILLLPGLKMPEAPMKRGIDQKKGPFPESFVLTYNQTTPPPQHPGYGMDKVKKSGLLVEFILDQIDQTNQQSEAYEVLRDSVSYNRERRMKGLERLPSVVVDVTSKLSREQIVDACMNKNPRSKEVFPNEVHRKTYCELPVAFRGCFFGQRIFAEETSFTAYYRCAYGMSLLNSQEKATMKEKLSDTELFYFLKLENQ